ncbi:hypothetical protein [Caulobacter sp.]|uniref:hypothetical protein n=1 Tax=Caulobacter sp. TaxID=78 RepID=UPI001B1FA8DB|nr:hypothetical protein [Caulobacter sp.]MBO9543562.1 hypothetical protein [Caulobacter sp.]
MRSTWSILAAGALLALPAAASAQQADLFSQFQQACVQGNAQPERVRTAAKGWRTVKTPQGFDRAKAWSRDGYTLTSAVQRMDRGERRTCSISGPADPRAEAAAVAWAGGRSTSSGPVGTYLLLDAAKSPRPATQDDARDPNKLGRVSGVAVSRGDATTTLGLSTFAPLTFARGSQEEFQVNVPHQVITAWDFIRPAR